MLKQGTGPRSSADTTARTQCGGLCALWSKSGWLCLIGSRLLETGSAEAEVCTGMALGVDQDIACVCIQAEVPFVACVPFEGQEARWPADAQRDYKSDIEQGETH